MRTRTFTALAVCILLSFLTTASDAATVVYFSAATGGTGQQSVYAATTPISGTMTASVPLFNPGLGTLIQADFEFAGGTNGAWTALPSTSGFIDFNLSGPADVGGQALAPTLASGFSNQPIVDSTPIPYGAQGFANGTFTSGAFFTSLTGVGNITLSWQYSGSTAISTPAIGQFDWGGSAHAQYTYEPVPEPAAGGVIFVAAFAMFLTNRLPKRGGAIGSPAKSRPL